MRTFGYYCLRALTAPLSILPLGFHRKMARFVAWLTESVFRYRRDTVMMNLSRSFPDKGISELLDIRRKFYLQFANLFCEAVWFGGSSEKRLRDSHIVEVENPELLNEVYASSSGVLVLCSHSGNWELLGGIAQYAYKEPFAFSPLDCVVPYRRLTSRPFEEFMKRNRLAPLPKEYDGLVESFSVLRYAISHRHDKKLYFFITDQYPYSDSCKVPARDFMRQPTLTMNAGAELAQKFSMPVMYLGTKVKLDGNYSLEITKISDDASKDDVARIMDCYYNLLEHDIDLQPWNYLWTHRRWK